MQSTVVRPLLVLALGLALVTPGCLSALEGSQPEDPSKHAYLLHANDSRKAPHPVAFDGSYLALSLSGTARAIDAPGSVQVLPATPGLEPRDPPRPPGPAPRNDSERPWTPPADAPDPDPSFNHLVLYGVDGRFVSENGTTVNLTNALVRIPLNASGLAIDNVTSVLSDEWTFRNGRAHVHAPFDPSPTVVPVNVTYENDTIEHREGQEHPLDHQPQLTVAPNGTTVTTEASILHGPPDPGDANRSPDRGQPSPHQGNPRTGRLVIDGGTYAFGSATLAFQPPGPVDLEASNPVERVELREPASPITLYNQTVPAHAVYLTTSAATGTLHPGDNQVRLQASAIQWTQGSRPQFEAATHARLDGHGEQATIQIQPGTNQTLWAAVEETSRVGTAERVEPNLVEPLPDEDTLTLSPGLSWYDTPDPTVLEEIGSTLGKLLTAWFVDPNEETLDPGETRYLPLVLHAPEGAAPGRYPIQVDFMGENTRSNTITLDVSVQ